MIINEFWIKIFQNAVHEKWIFEHYREVIYDDLILTKFYYAVLEKWIFGNFRKLSYDDVGNVDVGDILKLDGWLTWTHEFLQRAWGLILKAQKSKTLINIKINKKCIFRD